MVITIKQFNEFFTEKKKGTYHCPICGEGNFAINVQEALEQSDSSPVAQLAVHGVLGEFGQNTTPLHHDFFSFSCTNCGHTDFFHLTQIENWLRAQPGKSNG